jgi:hypothetical protein
VVLSFLDTAYSYGGEVMRRVTTLWLLVYFEAALIGESSECNNG